MKNTSILLLLLCLISLIGCTTPSQPIQQGKDLSTSGIAYTVAVDNLLDVTEDRVIDFDNQVLMKTRRGSNLRDMIMQKNEAVQDLLSEIGKFRAQTTLLKAYFLNLQALADSSVKNDMAGALQSLSKSISDLNGELGGKETLSDQQAQYVGELGGLIASSIQAEKVKRALRRDAEIIGTYLAHQENQLSNITDILRDRFQAENDLFLNSKVIAPYVDANQPLPSDWAENRKQWFKSQFLNQQLETAQQAARQLRGVWADILQGKSDLNSLSVLINDVNEFVTTVHNLEQASDPS